MSTALEPESVATASSSVDSAYLFTTEDFCKMIDAEIFPDEARVELWDGRIHRKMAKDQAHSFTWTKLNAALLPILPPGWSLWSECSILIRPNKAPLPDLMILRGAAEEYRVRRPEAADAALVIEVADSSLKIDTGAKLAAYARAGVAAYWIINLKDGAVHVYTDPVPSEGRYTSAATIGGDGSIPFALDGKPIAMLAASDLL